MRKQWNTVLLIVLILLVVLFAVMNVEPVAINFGFSTVSIPLVVVIIGTLLIGVIIAVIWSTSLVLRERNQQKNLQKKMDEFETTAAKEQANMKETHQTERNTLKQKIEKRDAEIRELKRRIQNMKSGQNLNKEK